jgi:hypothetical protein
MTELIDRLQIGIAPHKNLHPELLSRIFYNTLPDDFSIHVPVRYQSFSTKVIELQWLLGHVCQQWRNISLSERGLWCKVEVAYPPQSRDGDALMTILSRSGTRPLELLILTNGFSEEKSLHIISPHASRIFRLTLLDCGDIVKIYNILHDISAPGVLLHSLEEITIYSADSCGDLPYIDAELSQLCPMLRKFDIILPICGMEASGAVIRSLHLPSGTLSELHLKFDAEFHTIFFLLTENPQLEKLTLWISGTLHPPALPCITLPYLRELHIDYDTYDREPTFLAHLTLPALLKFINRVDRFSGPFSVPT